VDVESVKAGRKASKLARINIAVFIIRFYNRATTHVTAHNA